MTILSDGLRREKSSTIGFLWMMLSTVLFVAVDSVIKLAGKSIHPFEVGFFRNLFGFLFLLPALYRTRFTALKTNDFFGHLLRGVLGVAATLTFFYGLTIVPLVKVISLSFGIPIFAFVLAIVFLGEKPSVRQCFWTLIGFAGALAIIRPGYIPLSIGTLIILLSAFLNACIYIVVKKLSRTDSSLSIAAWMCLSVGTLTFPFAWYYWSWPTPQQYLLLILVGVLATSAQYALSEAFRNADASAMMPAEFLKLIWAALIGFFVFRESADVFVYFGAAIVITANVMSGLTKRRHNSGSQK